MIVTIPTGSQMDRITRCPASAALPQIHDANDNEFRDRGTAMHKFLERVAAIGRDAALAEVDDEHRTFCESIETAKLADRLTLTTEIALAYNWREDTARRLFPLDHRAYEVDATSEIPLTLDLAGVSPDERKVFSGDYKSGHGWLPAPNQSMQLGLGALALARMHDASSAQVEYIRVLDDGDSVRFGAEIDLFGLEAFADRVRTTMRGADDLRARVLGGEVPNVVEGGWCKFCPARMNCPAKTSMVRAALSEVAAPYSVAVTPDNAREFYQLIQTKKAAIRLAEAGLYAYAKLTAIPLETEEDGTVRYFGEHRRPGNDVVDGAIAHSVLAARYGGEVANKAVTMEITKAAIKDVVRPALKEGEKITHVFDAVIDEIKALGGIRNPPTCTTTEYTVSPEGAAKARKRKAS